MKTPLFRHLPLLLALALPWSTASADWKVTPGNKWSKEVRVWDSSPQLNLNFGWNGSTNARHEAEGEGELTWSSEDGVVSTYQGTLKAGKREGQGTWLHRSGAKYDGGWTNNLKHGKGEYWLKDGGYYKGDFRNDKFEGTGLLMTADGVIYEGTFLADNKEGSIRITQADGTSRESTWKGDVEVDPPPSKMTKPYLVLGMNRAPYAAEGEVTKANEEWGPHIDYVASRKDGDFVIEPGWQVWRRWNKGGPIGTEESAGWDFEASVFPVYLEVRVFNPGATPLSIVGAEVAGEYSHPDLEPLLDIGNAGSNAGSTRCGIANCKKTQVKSCEISYSIQPPTEEPKYGDYKFQESLQPFKSSAEFSISKALDSLGIDSKAIDLIGKLEETYKGGDGDLEKEEAEKKAVAAKVKAGLGPFAKHATTEDGSLRLKVRITGEMKVGWDDHKGQPASRTVKFTFLKTIAWLWPEYGAAGPSAGKYDVILPVSGENYSKPFPFRKTIKPNGAERFTLKLASDASTRHSFRVRLTAADGTKIVSSPCKMTFLLPQGFTWKKGFVYEEE